MTAEEQAAQEAWFLELTNENPASATNDRSSTNDEEVIDIDDGFQAYDASAYESADVGEEEDGGDVLMTDDGEEDYDVVMFGDADDAPTTSTKTAVKRKSTEIAGSPSSSPSEPKLTKTAQKKLDVAKRKEEREASKKSKDEAAANAKTANEQRRGRERAVGDGAEQFLVTHFHEGLMAMVNKLTKPADKFEEYIKREFKDVPYHIVTNEAAVDSLYWQRHVDDGVIDTEPYLVRAILLSDVSKMLKKKQVKDDRETMRRFAQEILDKFVGHKPRLTLLVLDDKQRSGAGVDRPIFSARLLSNKAEVAEYLKTLHRSIALAPKKTAERLERSGNSVLDVHVKSTKTEPGDTDEVIVQKHWRSMLLLVPGIRSEGVDTLLGKWATPQAMRRQLGYMTESTAKGHMKGAGVAEITAQRVYNMLFCVDGTAVL